uniref:Phosphatidylinositol transfer protein 1 (Trinotate prediction) n=1 Tax=Myxobolus squamalis TaxID=59785 RepID=A0A6B2G6D3_MYXSQ
MVMLVEFRIPLPMDVSEYYVAQLYAVAEQSKKNTGGGEGIKVLKNEPFDDENGKGQYTCKIFSFESRSPGWARPLLPNGCLKFREDAHNCYPNCRTEYKNEYLGEKLKYVLTSKHIADNGCSENVFNLSTEQLKSRSVIYINVADNTEVDSSKYTPETDPSLCKSEKVDFLPLDKDFSQTFKPIMCCYKLCEISFNYFLVSSMIERHIRDFVKNFLLDFHRYLICIGDEWKGMTIAELREHERKTTEELDRKLPTT